MNLLFKSVSTAALHVCTSVQHNHAVVEISKKIWWALAVYTIYSNRSTVLTLYQYCT